MDMKHTALVVLLALIVGISLAAQETLEAPETPADPALEKVDEMLAEARAEIREFNEAGGEEDDPDHPGRRWADELWKVRDEHPGTEAGANGSARKFRSRQISAPVASPWVS